MSARVGRRPPSPFPFPSIGAVYIPAQPNTQSRISIIGPWYQSSVRRFLILPTTVYSIMNHTNCIGTPLTKSTQFKCMERFSPLQCFLKLTTSCRTHQQNQAVTSPSTLWHSCFGLTQLCSHYLVTLSCGPFTCISAMSRSMRDVNPASAHPLSLCMYAQKAYVSCVFMHLSTSNVFWIIYNSCLVVILLKGIGHCKQGVCCP